MLTFYSSLPLMEHVPDFYIKGYTEALKMIPGVRVVPDESFLSTVPYNLHYLFEFKNPKTGQQVGFPMYYVPIKVGRAHYGFYLRPANMKTTPCVTWWKGMKIANLDALYYDSPYVVTVEGIKDAYLFLRYGHPVVIKGGAYLSETFIEEASRLGKIIVDCGDNDDTSQQNWNPNKQYSPYNLARKHKVRMVRAFPKVGKDYGEIFDTDDKDMQREILQSFRLVDNILRRIKKCD